MDARKDQSICPCCGQAIGRASALGVPSSSLNHEICSGRDPRLDVTYSAQTDAGPSLTRNVSSTGVYLDINADLKPGQKLSMAIDMQVFSRQMLWLCEAVVVRGEFRDGKPGYGRVCRILCKRTFGRRLPTCPELQ